MKFSEQWLREWVSPKIDTVTLTEQLTMAGLEVDGVEPACANTSGLIVAEVQSVEPHPDADKLRVCQVDNGTKVLNIVCGAPNVKAGMKTVLAPVGASLPDIDELTAVELKGVKSEGMLCSASEIGLGDDHDGIMELPVEVNAGTRLEQLFPADDSVIEISLTPNRGDCLSILGIAREVAVLNQMESVTNKVESVSAKIESRRNIEINEFAACPRYCGRIIEDVNAAAASPLWLTEKLRRSGIRSINILVDITNYVMLELGQPMHAFDNERLQGTITVRYPEADESLTLLDEQAYQLKSDTLLITDESGPLAMAGIMGGLDSAVDDDTRQVFLESAFFSPEAIIGKARQYGLHTDSSHRFERGVDPELQRVAVERATALILELCGGSPGPILEQVDKTHIPSNPEVILREERIGRVLGIDIDVDYVSEQLTHLQMEHKYKDKQWLVKAPSHRFDIVIEADLIEEIVRIYGYDNVAAVSPRATLQMKRPDTALSRLKTIRNTLVNRDYQEVVSFSFVDPELNKLLNFNDKTMQLANPIAPELAEMRLSIWPGLLTTLQYNLKRQQARVRLFETGLVFRGNQDLKQEPFLGGLICGNRYKKQWDIKNISSDLFDLKQDLTALLSDFLGEEQIQFRNTEHPMLHPGQTAEVLHDGKQLGILGQLHPAIQSRLDISQEVYLFEIYINNLVTEAPHRYQPISRFPAISRDIAIVLDDEIPLDDVIQDIKKSATNLLSNLELFDVYHGEGIEKGKKSLALGLTFQATSSTLKDEQIEAIMENVLTGLKNKYGAKLRE